MYNKITPSKMGIFPQSIYAKMDGEIFAVKVIAD